MDVLNRHFGLVIAYLLPGFVALAGIAPFVPIVAGWLAGEQSASFGAPLYALLAATAAGMVVSCVRWLVVDQLHALTGLGKPVFNARALEAKPAAFTYLVESHYRYHQFYANTLIALAWSYGIHRWLGTSSVLRFGTDLGCPGSLLRALREFTRRAGEIPQSHRPVGRGNRTYTLRR